MKDIVFLRHGKVVRLEEKRIYGETDIMLHTEGIEKTMRAGEYLKQDDFDAVYCSPLTRAVHSLENVTKTAKRDWPKPVLDARLKEMNFGLAEMKTHEEIQNEMPKLQAQMAADYLSTQFPNGESIPILHKRVQNFLQEEILAKPASRILVVAHSGVIRTALCSLLKLDLTHYWDFFIDFGGIVRVRLEGDMHHAMLIALNENE